MTGIIKTDQIQGASSSTVTIPSGTALNVTTVSGTPTFSGASTFSGDVSMNGTAAITGNTTVGGTLVNTGLITASAGVAVGGTGSANTLDDYEEGTWTPTITGGFTSVNIDYLKASYTRIGNVVNIFLSMRFSGTNAGATFVLGGLPFTSQPATANYGIGTGAIGYSTLTTYLNNTAYTAYVSQNNTTFQFYTMGGTAVASNANASNDWLELTLMYPAQ